MLAIVWERSTLTSLHRPVLLLLVLLLCATANVGRKPRNYGQVVVAVSPQIPLSTTDGLVDILKDLFTRASGRLYQATRNGTSFENVTILVPAGHGFNSLLTSSSDMVSDVSSLATASPISYQTADLRVDLTSPTHGEKLYTQQPRGCGQPGEFVHLTPEFLLDWNQTKDEQGVSLLVKHWIRYRYGVFDERGWRNSTRFPSQYLTENGEVRVTGCSSPYQWTLRPNTSCSQTEVFNQECQFQKKENMTVISSLLDDELAETLCDNSTEHEHVRTAPTQHNAMCQEKSVWSVLETHADFRISSQSQRTFSDLQPPVFRVVEAPLFSAVLVIDPHLCMQSVEFDKISWTFHIAIRKLLRELPAGSRLGMVLANNETENSVISMSSNIGAVLQQFHQLSLQFNVQTRELNDGLNDGYKMIKSEVIKTLIFMCDGRNISDEVLSDIQTMLENDNALQFFIVTYPSYPTAFQAANVKNLVMNHNIRWYNIHETETTTDECDLESVITLEEALASIVNQQSVAFYPTKTMVHYQYHNSSTTPANGTFVVASHGPVKVTCYLCSPSKPGNQVKMSINGVKTTMDIVDRHDIWTTSLLANATSTFFYSITVARPAALSITIATQKMSVLNPAEFVTIQGQVEDVVYAYSDIATFTVPVIRATVRKGRFPVLTANVEAVVHLPGIEDPVTIQLLDNGGGDPDVEANDGIYSRYFTQFSNESGLYDVRVRVNNNVSARTSINVDKSEENLLPPFTASSYVGSFYTDGQDVARDVFPPNRITDFQVMSVSSETKTITFQWTAPGDDLDNGRASSLELKCSRTRNPLTNNTNGGNPNIPTISWPPTRDAGLLETYDWVVTECDVVFYCIMSAKDDAGQVGVPSNIVSLFCPCSNATTTAASTTTTELPITSVVTNSKPEVQEDATTTQTNSMSTNSVSTSNHSWVPVTTTTSLTTPGGTEKTGLQLSQIDIYIIVGVVGLIVLVILMILCICCCIKRTRQTKASPDRTRPRHYKKKPGYHVDIVRRWSGDIIDDNYSYSHVSLQGGAGAQNTPPSQGMTTPPLMSSSEPERRHRRRNLVPKSIAVVSPPEENEDESDSEQHRYSREGTLELAPLPVLQDFPPEVTSSPPPPSTFRKGPARTLRDYQLPRAEGREKPNNEYQSPNGPFLAVQKRPRPPPDVAPPADERGRTDDTLPRRPAPPAYETLYPNHGEGLVRVTLEGPPPHGHYNDSFNANDDSGVETVV